MLEELKGEKAHWAAFRKELEETGREPTIDELEEELGFARREASHPLGLLRGQVEDDTGLEASVIDRGYPYGSELRKRPG